jgi:hypothetical protein
MQQTQDKNIHPLSEIQTRDPSNPAVAGLRLRQHEWAMPQSSRSNDKASKTVCDCESGAGGRDKGHGTHSTKLNCCYRPVPRSRRSDSLRIGRSGDQIPTGVIFFTRADDAWGPPTLLYNG